MASAIHTGDTGIKTMRTQPLLISMGLLFTLSACITPSTPLPSAPLAEGSAEQTPANSNSSALSTETSAAAPCELTSSTPEPLSTGENEAVFEQFNFRPQEIAVTDNTVTITSANHIFSLCQTNDTWSITSADASEDDLPYNYEKELAKIADPDYQTLEVENETYKYRIRLQAQWLEEQLKPDTIDPEAVDPAETTTPETATEDAVFFELENPDGELISQQLYTLSKLREAQLGASLGPPEIAGVASIGTDIWFATTASQGEGDSGFASLIHYSLTANELKVETPEEIQGDQITSLAITQGPISTEKETPKASSTKGKKAEEKETPDQANKQAADQIANSTENADSQTADSQTADTEETLLTLWIGTQRSGEGVPYFPASGLVAYQPSNQNITKYTINNSPLIGAIPHQVATKDDSLWVATGDGTCQVDWSAIGKSESWNCWKFTATATLPSDGVEVFDSFLADSPTATLNKDTVEVLWANRSSEENEAAQMTRYEVVYESGFETQLSQGGYRVANEAARRAAGRAADDNNIFWPGSQWHWNGERFKRSLDEVALNLVGGGPYGLVTSNSRKGFDFDSNAIRGEFDLLELTSEHTKVRYYSGWIEGEGIDVYPTVVAVEPQTESKPNPLTEIAADLTSTQGP
ncbi:MAG: hypothetical protein AAFQ63_14535 [Cyanobacteria bacterium J06621_11]